MINRITDYDPVAEADPRAMAPESSGSVLQDPAGTVTWIVRRHPEVVLISGVVLGLALGWWVKRR